MRRSPKSPARCFGSRFPFSSGTRIVTAVELVEALVLALGCGCSLGLLAALVT